MQRVRNPVGSGFDLDQFVPEELRQIGDPQTALPRIAKDCRLTSLIDSVVPHVPTTHDLYLGDARRRLAVIPDDSVHLVLTSPPYWTLKEYRHCEGSLDLFPITTSSCRSWTRFGRSVGALWFRVVVWWSSSEMFAFPAAKTKDGIRWCHCTPQFKSTAER